MWYVKSRDSKFVEQNRPKNHIHVIMLSFSTSDLNNNAENLTAFVSNKMIQRSHADNQQKNWIPVHKLCRKNPIEVLKCDGRISGYKI